MVSWSNVPRSRLAGLAHSPLLIAVLCWLPATHIAPQQPPAQAPFRITARADLVNVEVSVTDAKGNFVSNLTREEFRILDEGVEQRVTHFASIDSPAQILLLIETSPAVYLIHSEHLAAASLLLEGLAPEDAVALSAYDDALHPVLGFTRDKAGVAAALAALHYNLGMARLNLYESLSAALDALAPLDGKKAIVLLSTGLDESNRAAWEKLAVRMRASGVAVFPVALGGELRDTARKPQSPPSGGSEPLGFERADRDLSEIARLTGGSAYFPRDAKNFRRIYRQISGVLRHQYSLGFTPPARDARFHTIEVQILDARGRVIATGRSGTVYRVQARPGYLAPGP